MRLLFCVGFVLQAFFGVLAAESDYQMIPDEAKTPLLSPAFSKREVKKIQLHNGLRAYLISDPKTDQSAAALTVEAGSFYDPDAHPGMAHFLEHMLFLGTSKYPEESAFQRFVSENDGITNAFTQADTTSFLFTINNDAFVPALDRFAQFFISPLFNPSGVSREMQAIDQEFSRHLNNDMMRLVLVLSETANEKHPGHRFTIGNSKSLAHVKQEELKQWYRDHYSPEHMYLVVDSNLPMEKLESLVVDLFSPITNEPVNLPKITAPLFSSKTAGHWIYIEPVKDRQNLNIIWEIPAKFAEMNESKPAELIAFLLGHEGEGSLLEYLKNEKLAESLGAGAFPIGKETLLFSIDIELTPKGLKDVDRVIDLTYQAIARFRGADYPESLFDEYQKIAHLRYQYQERENTFYAMMKHARNISLEDLSSYPEKTWMVQTFNPQAANELIRYLTPEAGRYFLLAPSKKTGVPYDQTEEWMDIKYAVVPVTNQLIAQWSHAQANPSIVFPEPNPFVASHLALVESPTQEPFEKLPHPDLLIENDRMTVYYRTDARYGVPKSYYSMTLLTPSISMKDPQSIVMGELYVRSLQEALNPHLYHAHEAGLDYSVERDENGIKLTLSGYSEKMPLLLKTILDTIDGLKTSEEKFKLYRDILLRDYQNFAKESPVDQGVDLLKGVIYKNYVSKKAQFNALKKIKFDTYAQFEKDLFNRIGIEAMLYGNLDRQTAQDVVSSLEEQFKNSSTYAKNDRDKKEVLLFPQENGPYFVEQPIQAQGNAVILALQDPDYTFKRRASQQILMQAIKEPFFSTLRTKQQTGYLVDSLGQEVERVLFDFFFVESSTHDVRDLLSRFELFLETYLKELKTKELPEGRFDLIRAALIESLARPPKNVSEMGAMLNLLAFEYDADFDWINQRIEAMRALTYDEFLDYAKEILSHKNKRRVALLLKGNGPDGKILQYKRAKNIAFLQQIGSFVAEAK